MLRLVHSSAPWDSSDCAQSFSLRPGTSRVGLHSLGLFPYALVYRSRSPFGFLDSFAWFRYIPVPHGGRRVGLGALSPFA